MKTMGELPELFKEIPQASNEEEQPAIINIGGVKRQLLEGVVKRRKEHKNRRQQQQETKVDNTLPLAFSQLENNIGWQYIVQRYLLPVLDIQTMFNTPVEQLESLRAQAQLAFRIMDDVKNKIKELT